MFLFSTHSSFSSVKAPVPPSRRKSRLLSPTTHIYSPPATYCKQRSQRDSQRLQPFASLAKFGTIYCLFSASCKGNPSLFLCRRTCSCSFWPTVTMNQRQCTHQHVRSTRLGGCTKHCSYLTSLELIFPTSLTVSDGSLPNASSTQPWLNHNKSRLSSSTASALRQPCPNSVSVQSSRSVQHLAQEKQTCCDFVSAVSKSLTTGLKSPSGSPKRTNTG